MTKLSSKTIIVSSTLVFFLAGLIYCFTASKVYSSKSHIAIFRLKIEDPGSNMEESRNRWIWIRDGLNLKSALFTEFLLDDLLTKNADAKAVANKFPNKRLAYDHFSKMINVQFTGADENNYLIEVKAPTPQIALELNYMLFNRLKYLAVEADQKKFDELVAELRTKQQEQKGANFDFYEDKINKLTFAHIVEQKQKQSAVEVIASPQLNESPIWPRNKMILVVCAFIGFVFGLALDYVLKCTKRA